MKPINYLKLVTCFLIVFSAAFLGSLYTTPAISTWYATLQKPFFTPPNWLFAPVWTFLYFLMALSLFLIWRQGITKYTKKPLLYFFLQLILNASWSIAFFGLQSPLFGFLIIIFLWIFILLTIRKSFPIAPLASVFLLPYLLWVTFAALLNLSILILN